MAKKFNLDLSKFKKLSSDKHSTTLEHDDGHTLRLAHNSLKPELREQLAALPAKTKQKMAEGNAPVGEAPQTPFASGGGVSPEDYDKQQAAKYGTSTSTIIDTTTKPAPKETPAADSGFSNNTNTSNYAALQRGAGYADGGEVATDDSSKKTIGKIINYPGADPTPSPSPRFAEGGQATQQQASDTGDSSSTTASPDKSITINVGAPPQQPAAAPAQSGFFNDAAYAKMLSDAKAHQAEQSDSAGNVLSQLGNKLITPIGQAPSAAQPQVQAQPQQAAQPPTQAQPQVAAQQQAPTSQGDPYGTGAYEQAYMGGVNQQLQGIKGQAQAEGALGQAQAADLAKSNEVQQQQLNNYQDWVSKLNKEHDDFINDIRQDRVDPQHYLNSMGTGSKIATGIGLILGGIGGGLTHQGNPALQFLNAQIDRDIEGQKANLGSSQNLLAANMHQFGNARDAADMTKAMQLGIVANKLQQEAAKSQDPLAKDRALQAAGQLNQQSAGIRSQIAMKKTLLGGANSGQIDPARVVNMIVPEGAERAEANKELTEAQNTVSARDNLLSAFDKVAALQTVPNLANPQAYKQVAALKDPLLAAMSKGTAGRFTEADAKMLEPLWPTTSDTPKTIAAKRAQLLAIAQEKMHFPKIEAWGLQPKSWGRYPAGNGASKVQFTPAQ